jgi:hypothetical protein
MQSFSLSKIQAATLAGIAMVSLGWSSQAFGQSAGTAPNVTYIATGTFDSKVVSGGDIFKLAGKPFTINVIASEATKPHTHGKGYATYTGLQLKGTVDSNLVPQSPFSISSTHTFLALALGNPAHDLFEMIAPVHAASQQIMITAKITMPHGSITKWTIAPFKAPVTLSSSSSTVTYTDGKNATTLSVASGTLNAKLGSK